MLLTPLKESQINKIFDFLSREKQKTKDKNMSKYKLYLIRYLINKDSKIFSYEKLKDYEVSKLEWIYNHI